MGGRLPGAGHPQQALLSWTGFAAAVCFVVIASSAQTQAELSLLGPWHLPVSPLSRGASLVLPLVASLVLLVVCWLAVARLVARGSVSERWIAAQAALWSVPFVLGPPIASRDVYAYVAQGQLQQRGLDPYTEPVAQLGATPALRAVDPYWRHTLPPYGPVAVRLEGAVSWLSGGSELYALILWRLLAVVSCAVVVLSARRLVRRELRAATIWLAASPLLLVHLLGAAHLDAEVSALLLIAAWCASEERWLLAGLTAMLAFGVKATALLAVIGLLVIALRRGRYALGAVVMGSALGLAVGVACYARDPFGWVPLLATPAHAWNPSTPASQLFLAVAALVPAREPGQLMGLLALCRAIASAVAVLAAVLVLWRGRRSWSWPLVAVASLLLLAGLPVLYPWYAEPWTVLLGLGRRAWRSVACFLSCLLCFFALPLHAREGQRVVGAVEAAVAVLLAIEFLRRRRTVTR